MPSRQVDSILANEELAAEVTRKLPRLRREMLPRAIVVPPGETTAEDEARVPPLPPAAAAAEAAGPVASVLRAAAELAGTEAIIRRFGRPSLLIRNDTFEVPPADYWKSRLHPTKTRLDRAIRSIGRIEVPALAIPHVGTAWMIADGVAVTNRHVALTFAQPASRGRFEFRSTPIGEAFRGSVDFREEASQAAPFEVDVTEILFIADPLETEPDIAFIRLRARDGRPLPPPLVLYEGEPRPKQWIVTIGYPAEDPRNPYLDQARIFEGVFNVKRLAPGEVMATHDRDIFSHDCTTLGGSSGSVVLDVESGHALGLHFGGEYLSANYALSSTGIRKALERSRRRVRVRRPEPQPAGVAEIQVEAPDLRGRRGFNERFLGTGERRVPLPKLSANLSAQAVDVAGSGSNPGRYLLRYEHFSISMHAQRRMAIYTAVNIDGSTLNRLKRGQDRWVKDPRIDASAQIGNELYVNNDLDRGHLVRRLDPAWGATAKKAELDTFFYVNSTPQHASFNQTLWSSLEDYLLDHADTEGFRASIFTGPIFTQNDPPYRGVGLPGSYWKVAVMVRASDRQLSVTGYIVSQADLLTGLEFVYGQFKTYQVPVSRIEVLTGLDFGRLERRDPLRAQESLVPRELVSAADMVI